MKIGKSALAVVLAAACTFSGMYLPSVQAEDTMDQIPQEGLTGYWNFNDLDDPMANSAADSDLTAELSGTAVSVREPEAEERGGVLHFEQRGTANSEMRIANAINSGNEFTISLWVNNSSEQNADQNTIILQQSGSGRTLLYRKNSQYVTYISASDVTLGTSTGSDQWEHIVLVKEGDSTPYDITLYVNGEKAGGQNLNAGRVDAVTDLIIGAHKNASDGGQFVGDMDEIRLYDRALTEAEAAALYEIDSPEVPEPPGPENPIADGEYVYFGEYNTNSVKWRVLDADHSNTDESGMFMVSQDLLAADLKFNPSGSSGNTYQGSGAQRWCTDFYEGSLSTGEQDALIATTKSDAEYQPSDGGRPYSAAENILNGDKVFLLSGEEADTYFPTKSDKIAYYNGNGNGWWLRSPCSYDTGRAAFISLIGNIGATAVDYVHGARPACNIDLAAVIFPSAAAGGKSDTEGDSALTKVSENISGEWKLTLSDSAKSDFHAEAVSESEGLVTVSYSGATVGTNEYISAIIKDSAGDVVYYGRLAGLADASSGEGTVQVQLPFGFSSATGTLYVFNEQCNGDNKTDYASQLQEIAVTSKNVPGINSGTAHVADKDFIYFGSYGMYSQDEKESLKWRVLDADTTNTDESGMLIITEELLGTGSDGGVYFNASSDDGNDYQNSNAKNWCTDFYGSNLTTEEQAALLAVSKSDRAYRSPEFNRVPFRASDNILDGDKVFFLSAEEAESYFATKRERVALYNGENGSWWLRSPVKDGYLNHLSVGYVQPYGDVYAIIWLTENLTCAARPAANVNLDTVLFTSAAAGGKPDSTAGSSLAPVASYYGNEWKLTVSDSARTGFRAQSEANSDGFVTVSYSGAVTGVNEYISAAVMGADGSVTYYGRLTNVTEAALAEGEVQVQLPEGFDSESDTLYIFNEQCNGDYKTDYSSELQEINVSDEVTPEPGAGAGTIEDNDYVYFGNNAVESQEDLAALKWRVLDADTTNTGESGMFLITEELLGTGEYGGICFDQNTSEGNGNNIYQGSDAQIWCTDFCGNNLAAGEQAVLLAVTKSDREYTSSTYKIPYLASENILNGDKVFFLSAEEAETYFPSDNGRVAYYNGSAITWWLRSPGQDGDNYAGTVTRDGILHRYYVHIGTGNAARPAANVDLASVLFPSAAAGGKTDNATDGSLTEVSLNETGEWKLTVTDSARDGFSAQTDTIADGLVTISYSGAATGTNEYISAVIKNAGGNVTYYGRLKEAADDTSANGSVQVQLPADFDSTADTLYVFSEQCNGDYKTDYASGLQEISMLSRAETPSAVFNAEDDSSGTLSNVAAGMRYSLDGGTTWNDIAGTTVDLTGVNPANDIKVYQPGDGTTTSDSDIQTIDVAQAAEPAGLTGTACTTPDQNDGQINGVDTAMEYKASADSQWTDVSGATLTGLAPGTYEVRVKAAGTVLASPSVSVTVDAHACTGTGDWLFDEDSHWKNCTCGSRVDESAHQGGTAGYFEQARCAVCGQPYGELSADSAAPTGEIAIGTDRWKSFLNTITFGLFFDETQSVQITAEDDSYLHAGYTDEKSVEIEYYLHSGDSGLTIDELNEKELIKYNGSFNISPDNKYVVYARLTDHAGNVAWLSSDGVVLDASAPVISGIKDGETYCISAEFTVEEAYLDTVTVDGAPVTSEDGRYILAEGAHTVSVSDTAGNEIVIQVTVKGAHTPETDDGDCSTEVICSVCGEVTIPAAEHDFSGGWQSNENGHWHVCQNPGCTVTDEVMSELPGHTFTWVIDRAATETEEGSRHKECTVCGYKGASETIPATGSPDEGETSGKTSGGSEPPETGDDSSLLLWLYMGAAVGIVLTGTGIRRWGRKR